MNIKMIAAVFALSFSPVPASAFFWGSNPVRDAVKAGNFDLTLADYKAGTTEDRADLIAAYVDVQSLPAADTEHYVACMGWNAATKQETLEFTHVFGWCEAEAQNNRDRFEGHFNELDARDLSPAAVVICRGYVRDQLAAPDSAKIPRLPNVFDMKRQRYVVKSHFDAQNAYGAMMRAHYHCDVQFVGGESDDRLAPGNWDVLEFEILG